METNFIFTDPSTNPFETDANFINYEEIINSIFGQNLSEENSEPTAIRPTVSTILSTQTFENDLSNVQTKKESPTTKDTINLLKSTQTVTQKDQRPSKQKLPPRIATTINTTLTKQARTSELLRTLIRITTECPELGATKIARYLKQTRTTIYYYWKILGLHTKANRIEWSQGKRKLGKSITSLSGPTIALLKKKVLSTVCENPRIGAIRIANLLDDQSGLFTPHNVKIILRENRLITRENRLKYATNQLSSMNKKTEQET